MTKTLTVPVELAPCPFCYPHPSCDEYPPWVTQEIADSGAWCIHAPCCDFYGPLSSTKAEAARKWNARAKLIQTLHDNGDRIALEATVKQQAEYIRWLEAVCEDRQSTIEILREQLG